MAWSCTLCALMFLYEAAAAAAEYGCETECTDTPCASVVFASLCSVPAFLCRVSEFYVHEAHMPFYQCPKCL